MVERTHRQAGQFRNFSGHGRGLRWRYQSFLPKERSLCVRLISRMTQKSEFNESLFEIKMSLCDDSDPFPGLECQPLRARCPPGPRIHAPRVWVNFGGM